MLLIRKRSISLFRILITVALAGIAIPVHTGRAAVNRYFVKPTHVVTACTQADPCGLKTALGLAVSGDQILAAAGTYAAAAGMRSSCWINRSTCWAAGMARLPARSVGIRTPIDRSWMAVTPGA